MTKHCLAKALTFVVFANIFSAHAALTVDRSRLVFNEKDKSVSVNVTNRNMQDPYLAQGWMEDEKETKLNGPLMVLPPVQRVEAGSKTLVRIQALADTANLPKDRESVFWFNLREIPPKSTKPNVLMLAMQTRLKVFWRPEALKVDPMADTVPGTDTLTLTRQGSSLVLTNPTPYHFSFVELRSAVSSKPVDGFEPVMVAPKSSLTLKHSVSGNTPVLMFVNDYGSQRLLPFSCAGNTCKAGSVVIPKIASPSAADGKAPSAAPAVKEE
ncbi:molecular chaperone (plasmid) [Lelliottia sp. WB101]|uniref:fimbria/pilus periplasmic chaperone n=1 Tax=Lelliottia sp. WB101 TaxID=2153385 RepID=UPI000D22284A|nr:fimbria/pilus periplasmic chaperone [Lelliottia sp. WB101]AVZ00474.1 molecular chaperone [Lelliottia sp. WB101]